MQVKYNNKMISENNVGNFNEKQHQKQRFVEVGKVEEGRLRPKCIEGVGDKNTDTKNDKKC